MQTVTVIKSNLTVEVLKSNLRDLATRLGLAHSEGDKALIKEIYKDMTYYTNILYDKVPFDEYVAFEMELDELR